MTRGAEAASDREDQILVLYTEAMGYTEATLHALAKLSGAFITAVYRDVGKSRAYTARGSDTLRLLPRSAHDRGSLLALFADLNPRLVYVAGWGDRDYLAVARVARKRGIPVVSGLDNQWTGSLRQRVACLVSRVRLRPYFTHLQVAGPRQYEFARRLGFAPERILFNVYSADTKLFGGIQQAPRRAGVSRRLLYVGRFHPNKGLDVLAEAWDRVGAGSGWELIVIGNGDLVPGLARVQRVTVKSFLQPAELAEEVAQADAMILPSRREAWGVVVHEFAAAGLPLILSSACGAATEFLIPGYNGYSFRSEDAGDLGRALRNLFALDEAELRLMGERSRRLAGRITSETAAANLWSATIL